MESKSTSDCQNQQQQAAKGQAMLHRYLWFKRGKGRQENEIKTPQTPKTDSYSQKQKQVCIISPTVSRSDSLKMNLKVQCLF